MGNLQVVGLGLSTVDVLIRLKQMPTWENGGRMQQIRLDGGGPVGTGVVAAAVLGAQAGYIGVFGNDEIANLKSAYFTKYGVDISRIIRRESLERQIVLCYIQEDTGERVFAGQGGWEMQNIQPEEIDREYITSADYLLIDGFYPGIAIQAAQWMHQAGKKVVLDGHKTSGELSPKMRNLVENTDILICGSGFAPALTGEKAIWEAGKATLGLGPQIVVQTEGEQGCYTTISDDQFHSPAFNVAVVDTTGAGDVFHGAYIVGLLKGWDLRRTAVFASAVAAIKCTRVGGRAGIPGLDEVELFMASRSA